MYNRNSTK